MDDDPGETKLLIEPKIQWIDLMAVEDATTVGLSEKKVNERSSSGYYS